MNKQKQFQSIIDRLAQKDCLLAFSGGVDSALVLAKLLAAAEKTHARIIAVYVQSELNPRKDVVYALALAHELGAELTIHTIDELAIDEVRNNDLTRCYHCKKALFEALIEKARTLGIDQVIDGTNHDDLQTHRPGLKAIEELQIISPLAMAGLTKAEVRLMLSVIGLKVATRPSSPCMATRLPYGTVLIPEVLQRIEAAENAVKALGFYNLRVRLHGDIARIEVDREDLSRAIDQSKDIVNALKTLGFKYVTLDLEGFRSGSMDQH